MGNKKERPLIKNATREENINKNNIETLSYPIFCFKYLQDVSIKDSTDAKFFKEFLFRLQRLSVLGWEGIRKSQRHSFGTEKISVQNLKPIVRPSIVTPEVT
ncbi:MAG: hypothetical protein LBD28_06380, partial [Tannerellaceae bacterium]|nr:hypothetical protein [Tannerellaceae bacterium]